MNTINWYPGHMAKTRRQLQEQLKNVDLVIELCDARLPFSSRNPELIRMTEGKKRILMMNKADLADPGATNRWLAYFRDRGEEVRQVNATRMKSGEAIQQIENAVRDRIEKAAAKGVRKTLRAMVAGVPNVGKSTYINRLHGGSIAATGDRPGVTRSAQWIRISPWLELLDTPGMLWPRMDDQNAARRLCYLGTIRDEILDLEELSIRLMEDLAEARPEAMADRFRIADPTLRGEALMEAACRGRGFLLKGGVPDAERCARVALDEFRGGKMGRMTLELPPEAEQEEETR